MRNVNIDGDYLAKLHLNREGAKDAMHKNEFYKKIFIDLKSKYHNFKIKNLCVLSAYAVQVFFNPQMINKSTG